MSYYESRLINTKIECTGGTKFDSTHDWTVFWKLTETFRKLNLLNVIPEATIEKIYETQSDADVYLIKEIEYETFHGHNNFKLPDCMWL